MAKTIRRLLSPGLRCSVFRCQDGSVSQAVSKLLVKCVIEISCLVYSSILNIPVTRSSETSADFRRATCVIFQTIGLFIKYTVMCIFFTHLLPMFYSFKNYYVLSSNKILNFKIGTDNDNTQLLPNFSAVQWTGLTHENLQIIFPYGGYLTKYYNKY